MTDQQFNNAVDLYADGVYRFIVKSIRHQEDAKDIVQTSFEKLWINRAIVDSLKIKSYLFTVAYHQMIDHIRQGSKMVMTENLENITNHTVYQKNGELKQLLLQAINALNPTQKSLVLLKDYEGYSYQEIGEIMSLSESQVKVYLHRARLQLKNILVNFEKVTA